MFAFLYRPRSALFVVAISILLYLYTSPSSKMSAIKNVAIIGGSGNLGPAVVQALLEEKFTVTALTRASSNAAFPSGVKVTHVDYSSRSSIADALKGQDAVVSTIATMAGSQQNMLAEEAAKAGVKRFIPSEFGVNTQIVSGGIKTILAGKIQVQEHLSKLAVDNPSFSWTGLSTGLFFDWGLKVGFLGYDLKDKKATIWDSGNEPFTGTNLAFIGKAVAGVLQHPEQTANKYIQVASFITTQNEILQKLKEETGQKWTVEYKKTDDSQKLADEKLAKGDYSAFVDYLRPYLFGDGKGQSPKDGGLANELLELPKEDLRATVKAVLA